MHYAHAESLAQFVVGAAVARPVASEAVVVAHHHGAYVQIVAQAAQEFLCRNAASLVEIEHAHVGRGEVFAYQRLFFGGGGE